MASASGCQDTQADTAADVVLEGASSVEAIMAVTSLDSMLQSAKPLCGKCGQEVNVLRAQLKSKSGGAFVCNACHARVNLINRTWGTSVLDSFKELDEEEQKTLWTSLHNKTGRDVKSIICDSIARSRADKLIARSKGEWLPLTVYAARGYNVKDIEEKCKDVVEHPVLGTCYRVCIQALDRESTLQAERKQVLEVLDRKRTLELPRPLSKKARNCLEDNNELEVFPDAQGFPPENDAAGQEQPEESESESSDSSSSTSSSADKKKKKKKGKKHSKAKKSNKRVKSSKKDADDKKKKAAAAQRASEVAQRAADRKAAAEALAARKSSEKAVAAVKTSCNKVKAKFTPLIAESESALALICRETS